MEEDSWLGWHEVPGLIDGVVQVSQARGLSLTVCASSEQEAAPRGKAPELGSLQEQGLCAILPPTDTQPH